MPRLGVIELSQLPPFTVLETISSDNIITARMLQLVTIWQHNDPPNFAQYDVGALEFDPIKINQECSAYFETTVRDRVNQACRAVTLAFAVGGDLDAIGSRYPGGMPRLPNEMDDAYRTRIWLSPNALSPNGLYESYVFYAFTAATMAGTPLRDCQVLSTPGTANVAITIMADGTPITANLESDGVTYDGTFSASPSPTPSNTLITEVFSYITAFGEGRKGLTDVVHVNGAKIKFVDYKIRVLLYPGWDVNSTMQGLYPALAALLESQRYLGFSHTLAAIDAALKVSGVFNVLVDSPTADVIISTDTTIVVNSISLSYGGRGGFGPPSPSA
jgi:phage-related baseplate assembly protein